MSSVLGQRNRGALSSRPSSPQASGHPSSPPHTWVSCPEVSSWPTYSQSPDPMPSYALARARAPGWRAGACRHGDR